MPREAPQLLKVDEPVLKGKRGSSRTKKASVLLSVQRLDKLVHRGCHRAPRPRRRGGAERVRSRCRVGPSCSSWCVSRSCLEAVGQLVRRGKRKSKHQPTKNPQSKEGPLP